MTAEYTGDFGELRIETEMIDVSSALPYADEKWTYTDGQGHPHRYERGYPTLAWIVDETYWYEDCQDQHEKGHWECPLCDEHITPGTAGPDLFPKKIPGLVSYYLNNQPISETEAKRLIDQFRGQKP